MADDELKPTTFTGLLVPEQPIKDTDWILGSVNNPLGDLGLIEIVGDADWQRFAPFGQRQNRPGVFDTSDCTGFGYCRIVATRLNGMRYFGLLSDKFIAWAKANSYIQTQNGVESFMFDPRVLGIMAGTTANGNWLQVVADIARKGGLLPAGTLPGVETCHNTTEYYDKSLVTDAIRAKGLEFLQYIDLPYNWINVDTITALKSSPLYIAVCTCGGWNFDNPVKWCNAGANTNHCVGEIANQVILDSYPEYIKKLSADYGIPYKMQVLPTERTGAEQMTIGFKKASSQTVYVEVGDKLIAVADWNAFLAIGGSANSVIQLADTEFAKFDVVDHTLFKTA